MVGDIHTCACVYILVRIQFVCEYIAKHAHCVTAHTIPDHANSELENGKQNLEVILGIER